MKLASYRQTYAPPGLITLPQAPGGWGTIIADPPWPFNDLGSRATPNYRYMREEDIVALPVAQVRARDSHLYLWVTDSHLELGLQVVRAWGFEYKHQIVWVKKGIGGHVQLGMGHYFRKSHEVCLFAVSGKAKVDDRSLPSVFFAPRTQHSQKPLDLHRLAERASKGPRLELFARRQVPGWTCWGDQVELKR